MNSYSSSNCAFLQPPSLPNKLYSSTPKPKDSDLVRDLVMSRITKPEKSSRRNSRGSLNSLNATGSRSSLLDSRSSGADNSQITSSFSVSNILRESESSLQTTPSITESNKGIRVGVSESYQEPRRESQSNSSQIKPSTPRHNLPATPLTHPEQFKNNSPKGIVFPVEENHTLVSVNKTPSTVDFNNDDIQYNTLEEDSHLLNRNVSRRLIAPDNSWSKDRTRRASESEVRMNSPLCKPSVKVEKQSSFSQWSITDEAKLRENREGRLKKLLAEHRMKENEPQKDFRNQEKDVDSCIKECLEEYRQKRYSEPLPQSPVGVAGIILPVNDGLTSPSKGQSVLKRNVLKPSLLELESLQVFSSPVPLGVNTNNAGFSLSDGSVSPRISTVSPENTSPTSKEVPELRKQKKFKDRERRRSLIQVVAGMFNKSDEKKKAPEEKKTPEKIASRPPSVSPSPEGSAPPKSPSVRERFSKLRISRSKDKSKTKDIKNRSQSAEPSENPLFGNSNNPNAVSLPTSPSRTLFSFLSSKTADRKPPNQASEENNSEEEGTSILEISCEKDANASLLQTPSTRRQKAALRAAKQAEHKRLRVAQEIQRQLEECEVKTRELEEKGISVEKALRGEMEGNLKEEPDLMKAWFSLVHEKNALRRWEQELTVRAREIQLEDRHRRLESELRQRMSCLESEKTRDDIDREGTILAEMLNILEQKDSLVALLEEDRLRYMEEDRDLKAAMLRRGLPLVVQLQRETGV